jgi:two-component system chemotaxis response regulator CheB
VKTRVLLVDDSATALLALRRLIQDSTDLEVVGEARTGAEAVARAESLRPDLVTMDVYLGGQDGVDAARAILARVSTRVVMVTGLDPSRADLAFRALAVGALDVLGKPPAEGPGASHAKRRFLAALSALSRVRLIARVRPSEPPAPAPRAPPAAGRVVLLGASTGGPAALALVLKHLPRPFGAPIVVVQHIEPAHLDAFADWLGSSGHPTRVVHEPTPASPGLVFVAKGLAHLRIDGDVLTPRAGPPRGFHLPSIDELFESAASPHPRRVFAALLSGMGDDGAEGLGVLERAGATTVVQSLESCVVPGMPAAALRRGAARLQLSPEEIAAAARRFVAAAELPPALSDPR